MTSTSQPEFAGHCPHCGGLLYVGLVHACPTAPVATSYVATRPRFVGDQAPVDQQPDNGIRESDPNHGGSLIPSQYSNAA